MASVSSLRSGLATRLATISGLNAYARVPQDVRIPAAVVQPDPGSAITFDATMGRGSDDFLFVVTLLVSDTVDDLAQRALDPYLDGSGAQSVKAVIEADGTLGGVAHFARVIGVRDYGEIEYAALQYLGARFLVEVTA